ncbi:MULTISPECIES: ABC transporter permease [Streptomyces]|jgi:ABC-2 type transport system permease protein|uniref:ABC transporter permease n=1 Tax=Streptomyces TaxID=1883 RepID=UPI0011066C3F|nr:MULTISPECIES: ABC transporter permease [Streptomyces]MCZ4103174.1 ABC transporter permease [Streptomyces sp. H39-C1]MCZ4123206.1 ABC transporter permease [Streptomyces sp. H39-S7]MDF9815659.1 ABC-2 type transport system permease protein [Streptomyces sp. SPB162]NEA54888.1 ABC transporter permease [Streptomyces sp. SID13666]NEA70690.1 ABC transporter permease [Streptomyces sp. SID13588]
MTGYLSIEIKRMLRGPRFIIFAIVLPVGLYLMECMLYKNQVIPHSNGITYSAWLMCSLAAYSAFTSSMHTSARVAHERSIGWHRQLRLTPLLPRNYLLSKIVVSMIVALPGPLFVALAGATLQDVHLSVAGWLQITLGIWIAALPCAVLGLVIGLYVAVEQQQMYLQGLVLLFGFLGGLLLPTTGFPGWLTAVVKTLPSYWLADIGHGALLHGTRTLVAALVLAGWTVVLSGAVILNSRREAARA